MLFVHTACFMLAQCWFMCCYCKFVGNVEWGVTIRVRPIAIWDALMKKMFWFVFQEAAPVELKRRAAAGLGGGYLNNTKVLSSSRRGPMPDDRVPQRSTQSKTSLAPQIRNTTNSSLNFRVKGITHSWKYALWVLGYSLLTLPWQTKDFKMTEVLIKERSA